MYDYICIRVWLCIQRKQPTGAVVDLFNDLVNCADESTGATAKSICTKLLMQTVKRDISAVEEG
jgi:hypothetical protein